MHRRPRLPLPGRIRLGPFLLRLLNRPLLLDGRLPEAADEIVLEGGGELNMAAELPIGSSLTASVPNGEQLADSLASQTFTIVGHIQSPQYISMERGQTNIGDGTIDAFGLVSTSTFLAERVMLVQVRTEDSMALTAYTEAYDQHLDTLLRGGATGVFCTSPTRAAGAT